MRKKLVCKVTLLVAILCCCSPVPKSRFVYRPDLSTASKTDAKQQCALIYLGAAGGNRILITNCSLYGDFRICRKTDRDFVFLDGIKREKPVPNEGDVCRWVDSDFERFAVYKIVATDHTGNECEFPTIVATPREK
ncbi:MAG: hypothetical protein ABSH41_28860 [Syntrophobacteraceae bacterium]